MTDGEKKYVETFEVRLGAGRAGTDPNAPDWEVWEVHGDEAESVCDNLTQTEADDMCAMWTRKKDEAEAEV